MPDLAVAPAFAAGGVTLDDAAPLARWILRGDPARVAAAQAFGPAIPARPLAAAVEGDRAALWLGPDEWLLLAPAGEAEAAALALGTALAGIPHSLVDVGHRQVGLVLAGPGAAMALAAGVPLDLAAAAFPVGMVARTLFEKAEIVLWRTGPERFHLEVWRSFAPYLRACLAAAARDDAAAP